MTVAYGQVVQLGDSAWRVVERNDIFEIADFLRPDGRDDVLPRDRLDHVLRRQSVSLQFVLVQVDLDLQHLAAVRRGDGGSADRRQLWADEVLSCVEDLRLRQAVAGQRQLEDRDARSVEAQNVGRGDAGGSSLSTVCDAAVIWASAELMLTLGWKKILTTP